jgi:hypothetical protein
MLNHGARDYSGVLAHHIGAPPGILAELGECNQGNGPHPNDCGRLIETISKFHTALQRDLAAHRLFQVLELGDDPAPVLAEIAALEGGAARGKRDSFPITRASGMSGLSEATDFVEGLLTEGGASVLYGPSNCGKSFWILDLAVCVATGHPFRDELAVDQGAVVYVALEGAFGVRNRIEALRREGRLCDDSPLYLCFYPVSLLEPGHSARLAESVKQAAAESKLRCRLVIIDTLARAMGGGDENKATDMGEAVKSIDAIRAATEAHVCVIHHCGKDEARGARGHSSLRAAVDTEIEVSRPEGEKITTVRVTKQRDLPMGEPMPFSLNIIELGTDRRGKSITSCTVHHEDSIMASKPGKSGRKPKCTPEDMLAYLPADSSKEWKDRVRGETGLGESQFYEHKKQLEKSGRITREKGGKILVSQQMTLPCAEISENSRNSD